MSVVDTPRQTCSQVKRSLLSVWEYNMKPIQKILSHSILFLLISFLAIDCYAQTIPDRINSARSYQDKGDFLKALNELEAIGDIASLDKEVRGFILNAYSDLCREAINRSSRRIALKVTDSAINKFPKEKKIIVEHGKALLATFKYQEAVSSLGNLLRLEGGKTLDPEITSLGLAVQGYGLMNIEDKKNVDRTKMAEQGIKNFTDAIAADNGWYLPYLLAGEAYISIKDYKSSQDYYEKGMKLNPEGLAHMDYVFLASVYNANKLYNEMKNLLMDVPQKRPYWPGIHLHLGYAEENLGNFTEAFYQYNYEMFISGPGEYFSKGAQASLIQLLQKINNDQKLQEKYPQLALLIKAGESGANKDFKRSIENYEKVLAGDPLPNPILYLLLGEAYMQNNDRDKAISYLKKMLEIDPSFPPAYCEIGDIFADKGDMDNAIIWWEKGFNTDPENWKVKYTKDRLKNTKQNANKFSEFLKKNNI